MVIIQCNIYNKQFNEILCIWYNTIIEANSFFLHNVLKRSLMIIYSNRDCLSSHRINLIRVIMASINHLLQQKHTKLSAQQDKKLFCFWVQPVMETQHLFCHTQYKRKLSFQHWYLSLYMLKVLIPWGPD